MTFPRFALIDDLYRIKASRAKTIPSYSRVTGGKTSAFSRRATREEAEHFASEVMNPSPSSSAVRLRLGMLWS